MNVYFFSHSNLISKLTKMKAINIQETFVILLIYLHRLNGLKFDYYFSPLDIQMIKSQIKFNHLANIIHVRCLF